MVTSTQHSMIFTPRGTACPRVVTQDWLNADTEHGIIATIALSTTAVMPADDGWTHKVLMDMVDAVQDSGALVCQYRNDDGEVSARCLFPTSVTVTNERKLTCRAYCTMRREWRTFRLDRVLDCHPLTLPGEVAA